MLYSPYISELKPKDEFEGPFLVNYLAVHSDKNGRSYLNIILSDKTGQIEARSWEDAEKIYKNIQAHDVIRVSGKVNFYQGKRQLILGAVEKAKADVYPLERFIPATSFEIEKLYSDVIEIIEALENPFAKQLALSIFQDPECVEKIKKTPAAKSWHHAYCGGLLEHILSICRILQFLGNHYQNYYGKAIDKDLLILGALFHDIGKIEELSWVGGTQYTPDGQLIGHLILGTELVTKHMNAIEGFPEDYARLIRHQILAHHGKLEFGSPKEPQTIEALLVHYIDDLDSKVNSIMGIIAEDQNPGRWTSYNRNYERIFYKPEVAPKISGSSPGLK